MGGTVVPCYMGFDGQYGYCGTWLVEFRGIIWVLRYLARGVIWDVEGVVMGVHKQVYQTNRVPLQGRGGVEGDTEATKARLGTCQRGLGSYNCLRLVRTLNAPLMMTEIWLYCKFL